MRRNYGIGIADYEAMLSKQGSTCAAVAQTKLVVAQCFLC